jgi:NADH:ubiquinone oxidoreductase subunit 3 (subunit A)
LNKKDLFSPMASNPYFSLAVLFLAALGFGLAPLGLAWLWAKAFSPAKPNAVKNSIYECGLESRGDAWMQFRSAYYLYAIIFLIFDVEAVFLLPFAVAFTRIGRGGLRGHAGLCAAADRGAGVGLGQGRADVGVKGSGQLKRRSWLRE